MASQSWEHIFVTPCIFCCIFSGKGRCQPGNYGESVQQQGDRLRDDSGAESGDQQEAPGSAGGHSPQEHHTQGQHQHPRR